MRFRILLLAGVLALPAGAALAQAAAPAMLEHSSEYRFQIDLHVNPAALAKLLPAGWESAAATAGAAKDANLRAIFIDRINITGPDNKVLGKGADRLVYLAAPVKQTGGTGTGQMILGGISENLPGGKLVKASDARMSRSTAAANGVVTASEDWNFTGAGGEHLQLHVKYTRAPANSASGETKFYDPADPGKYQLFKTEQATDITRNVTTTPPDRVTEFSFRAGGGSIASLFDGSEKPLSWDAQPAYTRTISTP